MELIPTQQEVVELLRETGALRDGFFEYPSGVFSNQFLQVALAMSSYQAQKILSVGLSRLVRAHPEIRAILDELSIVTAAPGGLPVAYGVCEALRARRVYWGERHLETEPFELRQFLEITPGEKILLVDDMIRSGRRMWDLKTLVESHGGDIMGIAVVVYQPNPQARSFSPIPLYYLAKLDSLYCTDEQSCAVMAPGQKPVKVRE